ncbi:ComF family protein [Ramlibacter albus]|uniref:ComF family protein n=1 Tax=Ramlibacter albus TaxID=2079448 RepID=A0A923M5N4_9BURK|nr:ComF family protein [Ramlibacter albus]MBC5763139.1 ComF family protein [Ramlibacter albus]
MLGTWLSRLAPLVPSRCAACGAWPAEPVCDACVQRFAAPRPRCRSCALAVPDGVAVCGACLREPPPLERCHAAVSYGFPWSRLLLRFKFGDEPGWARTLAALMLDAPGVAASVAQADLVLPMPLSRERLALRGFNQSHELARALAPEKADAGLLLRLRDTAPQTALSRRERQANVRGAFGVEPLRAADVRERAILLVDDVMTSGASLFSAAQALRAAGAASVGAAVVARTDEPE